MNEIEDLTARVRKQISLSVELEPSEIKGLENQDDLLGSPLFLDSVDLLQVYADCQRLFNVTFNNAEYTGKHTVDKIVQRIVQSQHNAQPTVENGFFYSPNGNVYSLQQFEQTIEQLKLGLVEAHLDIHLPVRVLDSEPVRMMTLSCALLLTGYIPLISAQPDGDNAIAFDTLMSLQSNKEQAESTKSLLTQLEHLASDSIIAFETSGSTGKPVVIQKSLSSTLREVAEISQLLELGSLDLIDAYVSPVHMYGFIWCFLLPLKLNCGVMYQSNTQLRSIPRDKSRVMAVIVPTIWQSLSAALSNQYAYVVSSGGKFGEQRDNEFARLVQQGSLSLLGIDVLGSTETGAMGYRFIGDAQTNVYNLLPTVVLQSVGEGFAIQSAFLPYGTDTVSLDDQIEILSDKQIKHLGRKDNIFKFKGKRYSLKAIEDKLTQLFPGCALRVYFIEEENNKRGGELIAFVAKAQSSFEVTQNIKNLFQDLPIPTIEFLETLPTNAMGKVTLQGLQEKVKNARV